ncbi:MAG: hypothetical protein ACLQIK_18225 [Mycobacterium sp.]|uniref:hypothetical protein n=1 Tax=Mycobacterium sp. TaxID=1785 RepID=UPI003F9E0B61
MSWTRYEGRALADATLTGDALLAQLEDHIRVHNPQLTDVRLEQAVATAGYDVRTGPPRRWYTVTYLGDDGEGHQAEP